MPSSRKYLLGLLAWLLLAAPAPGQANVAAYKLERVDLGFSQYDKPDGAFKAGLWAPLFVKLVKAADGPILLPVEKDGVPRGTLTAATNDPEGTQGIYTTPLDLGRDDAAVITYVQPGTIIPDPSLIILAGANAKYTLPTRAALGGKSPVALAMDSNLYLTIGPKLLGFDKAIAGLGGDIGGLPARAAAYANDPARLPDRWFGYQAVDLVILTTDTQAIADDFLLPKNQQMEDRLAALIDWVRRGGHLVLSVSRKHQEKVYRFLKAPFWQPALPDLLSENETVKVTNMENVHQWANAAKFPATVDAPVTVALLKTDKAAENLIVPAPGEGDKRVPLMVRIPYGLGSVTLVAFELDRAPFAAWEGSQKFWLHLVSELGPKSRAKPADAQGVGNNVPFHTEMDLCTQLHRELDAFNVPMIGFGWVALFIFLYILVVGPLDYLILKKVFKRLEWTWITFPAVVIVISVAAYFTAYALKGDQLKINKIDLVDIDLRTSLDADFKTKKAYVVGTTWFSLLSPRIQNYTIGVQPRLDVWTGKSLNKKDEEEALSKVMVTWMGRPEANDPSGSGRSRSAGLFRRAYDYAPDATGLREVPIPVWTTKAFTASWEGRFDVLPLDIDLQYDAKEADRIAGTIQSNMPLDLEDVYLFYGNQYYRLPEAIPAPKDGAAKKIVVSLADLTAKDLSGWPGAQGAPRGLQSDEAQGVFSPSPLLKQLYFFDKLSQSAASHNHVLRPLDQSWRLGMLPLTGSNIRTAILIGRLARAEGDTKSLQTSNDPRLPTHLWLGALPGEAPTPPGLSGTMVQDTYIRIFVPVRPKV